MKNLGMAYSVKRKKKLGKPSEPMPEMREMPEMHEDIHEDAGEPMSEGGMVEDEDGDDFLTADMSHVDLGDETYPDPDNTEHEIDPKEKRRGMIKDIMVNLRSKHFGK